MNIFLIGMPGCGKSTLGSRLALEIGYEFVDMDEYIEKQACMFIDEIFTAYGEDYFRALEANALKELSNGNNLIIATGGGVIKNKKNKQYMNGLCIYLTADLNLIQKRLDESLIIRPLLQEKTIFELYEERKDLYEYFSDIAIDNTDLDKAISEILKEIKYEGFSN